MYLTARKKLREAPTMDELGDWVEANKLHICHWFTVNDLNYLKRAAASPPPRPLWAPCCPSSPSCTPPTRES